MPENSAGLFVFNSWRTVSIYYKILFRSLRIAWNEKNRFISFFCQGKTFQLKRVGTIPFCWTHVASYFNHFYKLKTVQSWNMNTLKCLHNLRKLMKEVTEIKYQTKTHLQVDLFSKCCCIKKVKVSWSQYNLLIAFEAFELQINFKFQLMTQQQ